MSIKGTSTNNKFSCFIIGDTSLLIKCAEILLQGGHQICGIISSETLTASWAKEKGIPYLEPGNDIANFLGQQPFDYLFSIVSFLIIPNEILALPRKGSINYHDGPLPRYSGVHATSWALINREKTHAVTWHIMSARVDCGDILKQYSIDITDDDTAITLNFKCYEAGINSFIELVDDLARGRVESGKQNLAERTYFAKYKRPPRACTLSWSQPADDIDALIRALDLGSHYVNPLGLPKLDMENDIFIIPEIDVLDMSSKAEPGTIISIADDSLKLATTSKVVSLGKLLTINGQPLSITDFVARFGVREGSRLTELDQETADHLTILNNEICRNEAFWVSRLAKWEPIKMPYVNHGLALTSPVQYATVPMRIPAEVNTFRAGHDDNTNRSDFLASALATYLARISNNYIFDLRFSYSALRHKVDVFERFFATHIPLHVELDPSASFGTALDTLLAELALVKKHQTYARDTILRYPELSSLRAHGDQSPLSIVLEQLECFDGYTPLPGSELTLLLSEDGTECRWVYDTSVLDKKSVDSMQCQFATFLQNCAIDSNRPVAEISLLTEAEYHQLINEWNNTRIDYPQHLCIHQMFEVQAERTQDSVAVVFEEKQLTYRELNRRANQLAHYLQSIGVGPDVLVGICMERSLEMVVGLYGILKAGGAHVPLNPTYPTKRIAYMLEDANTPVLLTQANLLDRLPTYKGQMICLDTDWNDLMANQSTENPVGKATLDNLAYAIYTSGSTGKPKGVMNTHRGILNRLLWMQDAYQLTASDHVLQKTPFSFDVSLWEFFWPLMFGARLVVARPEGHKDTGYLVHTIIDQQITTIHFVPSMLQLFLMEKDVEKCDSLRQVICSGETLSLDLQNQFFARLDAELHNLYGPTEASVDVTHWTCRPESDQRIVPIGRPVANTQIYILDRYMQPVPIGVPGELHIGGVQVARGYLNNTELTGERFIPDPFSDNPLARLYKTGDLARYLPDGNIEFLDRIDHQVKIRGNRIELGEIETLLKQHPTVREACVLAREDIPGDKRLAAYMVPSQNQNLSRSELRNYMKQKLPEFMIPSHFVTLDAFPLTLNQKIDREMLPAPSQIQFESEIAHVPAKNGLQRTIANIWQELLNIPRVSMNDNFFELGGNSLLIIKANHQLRKVIDMELSITDMFRFPTIRTLTEYLSQDSGNGGQITAQVSADQAMETDNILDEQNNFDIAIIGMSGRFPGANCIDEFWQNLRSGIESISFFSDEELKESGIEPSVLDDPNYIKAASVLNDPELFAASFFGCSPREAEMMDPQHRLFLECAWETLEHAGYDADRYKGPIGVFAGASMNTYILFSGLLPNLAAKDLAALIGSDKDYLTTRVSYKLNLKGPGVTVQTACSTSLVAVHMACQSLLSEECDMVLAGGVSIRVPHKEGYLYQHGNILSPDGHCRAFDAKAQGTIFGSGVGVVLLKRLDDAIADGDCIHAVIKGSAINNDGHSKVDYTAPSVDGQSKVILAALANAGVEADTISYIEAHGTGTALGDPIEVTALTNAFRNHTDKKGFCAIGSVKTNIGHLDAAAGIASLIKTTLALKNKMIPPSLHFEKANPEIDFQSSPFYVNSMLAEWKSPPYPRRAGVSASAIGGTNAHIILQEAPDVEVSGKSRPWQILLLSAKTSTALETATANLINHLKHHPSLDFADVAYTLQNGRNVFNHRRMVVCQDHDDAVTTLETLAPERVLTSFHEPANRDVVFIFSGQGTQYVNMGLELYKTEQIFKEQIDYCSEILRPHLSLDLRDILYPADLKVEDAAQMLKQTFITQPALFTVTYALAKLWMAWGVHPKATVGHSIGEYVAACLAGVFPLDDALLLVATRGRLMQELPGGSMMAVFLPEKEIKPFLGEKLSLAAVNGPSLCVVSGEKEAVEDLEKQLRNKNVDCRHLHISHAFHSRMMEPILDAFAEQIKQVSLNAPRIPFVSNVTGTWITPDEAVNPSYWTRHLRQTVRFSDCLQELLKEPNRVLLEVGPGCTFSTLAGQHPSKTNEQIVLSSTHNPKEEKSDVSFILNTLGQLWLAGIQIDWPGFYADESRHRLPLPTYPFERKRYWNCAEKQVYVAASTVPNQLEELTDVVHSKQTHPEQKTGNAYDGPNNNIEQTLANIWQGALGIKQVNFNDNFFDLGGNSLIAVQLFTDINKLLGKKLPIATLYEAPTIEQLVGILRGDNWTSSYNSLVKIQPGNSKPPLFCVHAGGGNVLIYRDLVRHLGREQPVYGLQSQGLDGKQPFQTRIEDMAAKYIQEIQTIQPDGPYFLTGFCMGGTVALEMALQLNAQKQEVALLAFIETYNWGNMPAMSLIDSVYYYLQKIEFNWGRLLSGEKSFVRRRVDLIQARIALLFEMIESKRGHKFHQSNGQYSSLYQLEKTNDLAAVNYIPKATYPGRIIQFVPTREYAYLDRSELGWDRTAAGGVELYKLPVYPRQMLTEPFARLLADQLKVCIKKALETESAALTH